MNFEFPNNHQLKDGTWRPIYFRSNFDTPERLVAGVVACVDGKWHLQIANALDRLKCLYGKEAQVAIDAVYAGLRRLDADIRSSGRLPADLVVSGLFLGDERAAQANDAASLSQRWLRTISALHDRQREFELAPLYAASSADEGDSPGRISREIERDRLSVLVFEEMANKVPQSRAMFNQHVRKLSSNESSRLISHEAYIAYDGKKLAANFSTIKAGRNKVSVDIAKRLMWDLEQHREKSRSTLMPQSHDMFIYYPGKNNPQITERQYDNVIGLVENLSDEGRIREINVRAFDRVDSISNYLIEAEGF
jgi:hypothetical protein